MKSNTFKIPKPRTCLAILVLVWISFSALYYFVLPAVHRHLGFCPLSLCKFDISKSIPVVYGLPMSERLKNRRRAASFWGDACSAVRSQFVRIATSAWSFAIGMPNSNKPIETAWRRKRKTPL